MANKVVLTESLDHQQAIATGPSVLLDAHDPAFQGAIARDYRQQLSDAPA